MRWSSLRRIPYRGIEHARSHGAEHLVDVEASPDGEPHSSGIYRGDSCEVRRGEWATDLSPRQDVSVYGSVARAGRRNCGSASRYGPTWVTARPWRTRTVLSDCRFGCIF